MKRKDIKKVIVWGYPLHTHTQSYVHYGWDKGFRYLGYDTYWFHDNDFKSEAEFDYTNCIFIGEGYGDKNIPLNPTSVYFINFCVNPQKYIDAGCRIVDIRLNVDEIKDCNYNYNLKEMLVKSEENNLQKLSSASYYQKLNNMCHLRGKESDNALINYEALYTMWATDMMPDDFSYDDIDIQKDPKLICYFGSLSNANHQNMTLFVKECDKNGIRFIYNDPWKNPISFDEAKLFTQKSIIAPDIRGTGDPDKMRIGETGTCHKKIGYIPCRIFKNISYGCLGITNSRHVYELLEGKVIYSDNEAELFHLGIKNKDNHVLIREQMDLVKRDHTYLNRCEDILKVVDY
jgi:hypothetical protein